jgi:hypothetical protein
MPSADRAVGLGSNVPESLIPSTLYMRVSAAENNGTEEATQDDPRLHGLS